MIWSTENLENTGINVAGTTPLKKLRVTEALQKSQKKMSNSAFEEVFEMSVTSRAWSHAW